MTTSRRTGESAGEMPQKSKEQLESEVSELISAEEPEDKSPQDLIEEIHAAAALEAGVDEDLAFGRVGPALDRRSPFYMGMTAALGVAVIFVIGAIVVAIGQILLLIALSIVIAVGLDPVVRLLMRRGFPRWAAVTSVIVLALAIFGGFLALAIPIVVSESTKLAGDIPGYLHSLNNHSTFLGKLNAHYHLVAAIQKFINKGGSSAIAGGVLGVGKIVLDLVGAVVVVVILAVYILADLPRV